MSRLKSALMGAVVAAGLVLAPLPAYAIAALPGSSATVNATPGSQPVVVNRAATDVSPAQQQQWNRYRLSSRVAGTAAAAAAPRLATAPTSAAVPPDVPAGQEVLFTPVCQGVNVTNRYTGPIELLYGNINIDPDGFVDLQPGQTVRIDTPRASIDYAAFTLTPPLLLAGFSVASVVIDRSCTPPLAGFTGMTPTRVLNTTVGLGAPKAKLGPGKTLTLTVPGLPAGGATAVALSVMVQNPTATGYLTVYPGGKARPGASNLTYVKNQIIPNLVLVPLGPGSTVTFYNSAGTVNVFADMVGYYKPDIGSGFTGMTPTRVLNTVAGLGAAKAKLGPARTLTLTVPGLPAGTTAVAVSVMVQQPTTTGYLTVYPGGRSRPGASNLTFVANQITSNLVLVPLGPKNTITIYNSAGTVNVFGDLVGYYKPGVGGGFTGMSPTRVLNTTVGLGAPKAKLGAARTLTLTVPGLPAGTTAVAVNVMVQQATAASYLTVYPGGRSKPGASNLTFVANQIMSNLVLVPLGPKNTITIYNRAGTVNVFADLVGYYK